MPFALRLVKLVVTTTMFARKARPDLVTAKTGLLVELATSSLLAGFPDFGRGGAGPHQLQRGHLGLHFGCIQSEAHLQFQWPNRRSQ